MFGSFFVDSGLCRKVVGHPHIRGMMVGCSRRLRRKVRSILCVVRLLDTPHTWYDGWVLPPVSSQQKKAARACVSRVKAFPRVALAYMYLGLGSCHNGRRVCNKVLGERACPNASEDKCHQMRIWYYATKDLSIFHIFHYSFDLGEPTVCWCCCCGGSAGNN